MLLRVYRCNWLIDGDFFVFTYINHVEFSENFTKYGGLDADLWSFGPSSTRQWQK